MRPLLAAFLLLAAPFVLQGHDVVDGSRYGFTVRATKTITITSPSGDVYAITTTPFVTNDHYMPPSSPILCSWSPDGTIVAVFVQQLRVTSIYLFNLATKTLLLENDANPPFPDWYNAHGVVYSTTSVPGEWADNSLSVATKVKWRDPKVQPRSMAETLTVNKDGTFSLRPSLE